MTGYSLFQSKTLPSQWWPTSRGTSCVLWDPLSSVSNEPDTVDTCYCISSLTKAKNLALWYLTVVEKKIICWWANHHWLLLHPLAFGVWQSFGMDDFLVEQCTKIWTPTSLDYIIASLGYCSREMTEGNKHPPCWTFRVSLSFLWTWASNSAFDLFNKSHSD